VCSSSDVKDNIYVIFGLQIEVVCHFTVSNRIEVGLRCADKTNGGSSSGNIEHGYNCYQTQKMNLKLAKFLLECDGFFLYWKANEGFIGRNRTPQTMGFTLKEN